MLKEDTTLVVVIVQLAIPLKFRAIFVGNRKLLEKHFYGLWLNGLSVYWTQIPVASWVWRANVEEG
jgi:hypothetical protein